MNIFRDYYNNEVKLSFEDHPFSRHPKHVWAICTWKGQWLLTKHKDRGLEFPGGKVEEGETAEEAAIREIKEETGATVKELTYVGQYYVDGKSDSVIKNVYYAVIDEVSEQDNYFETEGPVLLKSLPTNIKRNHRYSFIMKDDVLPFCMEYIQKYLSK